MNEFVLMTGANKENVERIISNVIYIFYQHAEVMSNRILIERYYTYYVNVFKKSPMIFSCDAMLF